MLYVIRNSAYHTRVEVNVCVLLHLLIVRYSDLMQQHLLISIVIILFVYCHKEEGLRMVELLVG